MGWLFLKLGVLVVLIDSCCLNRFELPQSVLVVHSEAVLKLLYL